MTSIPTDLKYTRTHEWVKQEHDGSVTVGITEHAQQLLGDLVFVQLPHSGDKVSAGGEAAVVESVKAASDVYAPISGQIISANETLSQQPELVNQSPYTDGWIFKIMPDDAAELNRLLDDNAYRQQIAE